jgi:hypothetical protein
MEIMLHLIKSVEFFNKRINEQTWDVVEFFANSEIVLLFVLVRNVPLTNRFHLALGLVENFHQ